MVSSTTIAGMQLPVCLPMHYADHDPKCSCCWLRCALALFAHAIQFLDDHRDNLWTKQKAKTQAHASTLLTPPILPIQTLVSSSNPSPCSSASLLSLYLYRAGQTLARGPFPYRPAAPSPLLLTPRLTVASPSPSASTVATALLRDTVARRRCPFAVLFLCLAPVRTSRTLPPRNPSPAVRPIPRRRTICSSRDELIATAIAQVHPLSVLLTSKSSSVQDPDPYASPVALA